MSTHRLRHTGNIRNLYSPVNIWHASGAPDIMDIGRQQQTSVNENFCTLASASILKSTREACHSMSYHVYWMDEGAWTGPMPGQFNHVPAIMANSATSKPHTYCKHTAWVTQISLFTSIVNYTRTGSLIIFASQHWPVLGVQGRPPTIVPLHNAQRNPKYSTTCLERPFLQIAQGGGGGGITV